MNTPSENAPKTSPIVNELGTGGAKSQSGSPFPSRLARLSNSLFHVCAVAAATFASISLIVLAVVPKWPMNSIALAFILGAVFCVIVIGWSVGALYKHIEYFAADNECLEFFNDSLRKELLRAASEAGEVAGARSENQDPATDRSITFPISSHPKWKGF